MNTLIVYDFLRLEEDIQAEFLLQAYGRKKGRAAVGARWLGGSGGDVGRETGAAIYVSLGYCNA